MCIHVGCRTGDCPDFYPLPRDCPGCGTRSPTAPHATHVRARSVYGLGTYTAGKANTTGTQPLGYCFATDPFPFGQVVAVQSSAVPQETHNMVRIVFTLLNACGRLERKLICPSQAPSPKPEPRPVWGAGAFIPAVTLHCWRAGAVTLATPTPFTVGGAGAFTQSTLTPGTVGEQARSRSQWTASPWTGTPLPSSTRANPSGTAPDA